MEPPIGRMYFVQPTEPEQFYLRQLLLNTPGATSYEDLRTTSDPNHVLPDVIHEIFLQAYLKRGLLIDDQEWSFCMEEASMYTFSHKSPTVCEYTFV